MSDIMKLTAVELGSKIAAGELSSVEATKAALDAIGNTDKKVHAFVTVDTEGAIKRAEEADRMIAAASAEGKTLSPLGQLRLLIQLQLP